MTIQHLRSSTANKRPTAAAMSDGQLAVNTNATNPGLFFKDADSDIRKVGPIFIGSSAPNSSPATNGSTGHSKGESWLDTSSSVYSFKIYDGSAWRSASGTVVDSSNNVGIGTLSPSNLLHVSGTASTPAIFENTGSNGAFIGLKDNSGNFAYLGNTNGVFSIQTPGSSYSVKLSITSAGNVGINNTSPNSYASDARNLVVGSGAGSNGLTIASGSSNSGTIYFADGTSGASLYTGTITYSHSGNYMAFWANENERMRIESSGASKFSGTIAPSVDNTHNCGGASLRWGAVYAVNGTIQTSDQREKTDILDSSLGFNFVKSLRPVSYKWINGGQVETGVNDDGELQYTSHAGQRTHWGFIAQEVKEAVDEAGVDFGGWVLTDKDDPNSQQALRYDQFIAPLTKALQEAIAKIETLEAKVAALEAG